MASQTWNQNITITDPPVAVALFSNTRWAWIWLILRLYVGYTWLTSGWGKLSNPGLGAERRGPEGLLGAGGGHP